MEITEDRFRLVFRQLYPNVARYVGHLVEEADVQDVVQEAFLELWKHRKDINDKPHLEAFLYRSAYTRAVNLARHRAIARAYSDRRKALEAMKLEYLSPENNEVMRRIERREAHDEVMKAIDELPQKRRMAFTMSYLHGMKNKEIARIMGTSVRTVDVQVYQALRYLRERLRPLKPE